MRKAEGGIGFFGEKLELIFGHFTFEIVFRHPNGNDNRQVNILNFRQKLYTKICICELLAYR